MLYELYNGLFNNNTVMLNIQSFLTEILDKYKNDEHTKVLTTDIMKFLSNNWSKVAEKK